MKRACIFASYWHTTDLPDYIHFHVEALAAQGFDVHFISNSPLCDSSKLRLAKSCKATIERQNIGYDFGAWRDAFKSIRLNDYEGLLLTNSSIVGPLHDLAPVFEAMAGRKCDFWGLTLNRLYQDHLQSFFLYFTPKVFKSEAWDKFWDQIQDHSDKRKIILEYELKLYQYFVDAGFNGLSYIKPNPLWSILVPSMIPGRKKKPVYFDDPTISRAITIVKQGFPYVKASLLWGEAKGLGPSLENFRNEIKTAYNWRIIEKFGS